MTVVGVGGGGNNAVNRMIQEQLHGVRFVAVNTDVQALHLSLADTKIQIGKESTRGLGAGGRPAVGRKAIEEDLREVIEAIRGSDLIFITAGMGGGTGTGAAPEIARQAKEMGILTIAIVTTPFSFEGRIRARYADEGVDELTAAADTVIVVPNNRLREICEPGTSFREALKRADEVLLNATRGISGIIARPAEINTDFADVRTIMANGGPALMGRGEASGPGAALQAAQLAVDCPLLDNVPLSGATRLLVNIRSNGEIDMMDVNDAVSFIGKNAHRDAEVIFGMEFDEKIGDGVDVTVIATGFDESMAIFSDSAQYQADEELDDSSSSAPIYVPEPVRQDSSARNESKFGNAGPKPEIKPASTPAPAAAAPPVVESPAVKKPGFLKRVIRAALNEEDEGKPLSELPPRPAEPPSFLRVDS